MRFHPHPILFLRICRRAWFSIFPRHSPSAPVQWTLIAWLNAVKDDTLPSVLMYTTGREGGEMNC